MSQASVPKEEIRRPLSTLACITAGFEVVARHPELIILPFLLDLFLWLGPRLSIAPLLNNVLVLMRQLLMGEVPIAGGIESYRLIEEVFTELSQGFNLFSSLHPAPLLGAPSLMARRLSAARPLGDQPAIEVASFLAIVGLSLILSLIGLTLNALYLRHVGQRVQEETEMPLPGPGAPSETVIKILKLGMIVFVVLFGFSTVVFFFGSLVGLLSLGLATILMTLASSSVLFAGVHLIFAVPSMVMVRRRPLRAIRESLILTRSDFLNVLFLLGLILVISQGLNVVWTLPAPDSWATLVGLAGHAFVSTALTTALFVFYQERLCFLEMLKKLYAGETKEVTS